MLSEHRNKIARFFGFIPNQWSRMGGLTIVTNFFLHVGWLHLLGNMYFLLVFGDNVEDRLGRAKFVMLLVCATVAGNLLHGTFAPRSGVPRSR